MNDPLHDVFEMYEPPPGGLAELRRRIRGERAPRWAWAGGLAVAAVAATVLLVVSPTTPEPGAALADAVACADPALSSLLCGGGQAGATVAPGHRDRLAFSLLPSADARVILYRVASASAPLEPGAIRRVEVERPTPR